MPMTVVITRDVVDRFRGFAASIMPEVAPGVFVAAELSRGVRERMWKVFASWWDEMPGGSILLVWRDDSAAGRLGMKSLGLPVRTLADLDGFYWSTAFSIRSFFEFVNKMNLL